MEEGEEGKRELAIAIERENYLKRISDIKLNLLTHRFLPVHDRDWLLVRSKLILLYNTYYRKYSIRLCAKCLTIYSSNRGMKHQEISIRSVFDHIQPIKAQGEEIAVFFAMNGRTRTADNGELLVGVPSFDYPCEDIYRFLDGSSMPKRSKENDTNDEAIPLKVQEPMIIISETDKMVLKQKKKTRQLFNKQEERDQNKKEKHLEIPIQKVIQQRKVVDIKTPEKLSKRAPERRYYDISIYDQRLERSGIKNKLKSPMKPFIVSTANGYSYSKQGLRDDIRDK